MRFPEVLGSNYSRTSGECEPVGRSFVSLFLQKHIIKRNRYWYCRTLRASRKAAELLVEWQPGKYDGPKFRYAVSLRMLCASGESGSE